MSEDGLDEYIEWARDMLDLVEEHSDEIEVLMQQVGQSGQSVKDALDTASDADPEDMVVDVDNPVDLLESTVHSEYVILNATEVVANCPDDIDVEYGQKGINISMPSKEEDVYQELPDDTLRYEEDVFLNNGVLSIIIPRRESEEGV